MTAQAHRPPSPLTKFLIEAGPLAVFFVANARGGIYVATGALMVALVLSLAVSWKIERRLPLMALVTAVFALIFGGLTLLFHEDVFIKVKPTIVNLLFAGALFAGLVAGRSFLKVLLGEALKLDEPGWRQLTLRWACFFVALAVLNEIVWRGFSNWWVSFKVFGIMPLTILFTLTQIPLIKRHSLEPEVQPEPERAE